MSFLLNLAARFSSDAAIEQFSRVNIPYEAACDVALSNDSFIPALLEHNDLQPYQIAALACNDISNVVDNLVNTHPNEASSIFEELLYYRNKGRI
jgi:hypothetical protein